MTISDTYSIAEVLITGSLSILCLILVVQKVLNKFSASNAENTVVNLMHTELKRMAEQNQLLSVELGKLQEEIIQLNQELRQLTAENQRLHIEVERLTTEIAKFKELALIRRGIEHGQK